jgi:AcrR family transcriptional regulator
MSEKPNLKIIDGRRQRSERSRAAIITATLSLINGGNLAPTARQIAEEAGIGLRSFFRHFEDMDALLDAVDAHIRQYYEPLFSQPLADGPLEVRLENVVIARTEAYEHLKTLMLTSHAQLWRSDALRKNYARNQKNLRKHLETCLPEIMHLPVAQSEAAHAMASFELWHRLREHQKLNISDARMAMIETLTRLLED